MHVRRRMVAMGGGPAATSPLIVAPPSFSTFSLSSADTTKKLERTQGAGTSRRSMAFNCWIKPPAVIGASTFLPFYCPTPGDSIFIDSAGFHLLLGEGTNGHVFTNSAPVPGVWQQLTVAINTTQATDTQRVAIYVDGIGDTNTGTSIWPVQNFDTGWGNGGQPEGICKVNTGTDLWLMDEASKFDNLGGLVPGNFADGSHLPIDITSLFSEFGIGPESYWLRFETGLASTAGTDSGPNGFTFTNTNFVDGDFSSDVPT